ncbi:MAG: hypothetical protein R6U41_07885 [Desulfosalsimonas sp.]|uniref:hypothetical protein n=1 Tax=Desulfosalsimonas sp. TaxID=3073848 RepID=UPI0039706ECA
MTRQASNLKQTFTFTDFLAWTALALIPVLTAIHCISRDSMIWTGIYTLVAAACLVAVHRFFCTHCPPYSNAGKTTRCMFIQGLPAFFKPRPGACIIKTQGA